MFILPRIKYFSFVIAIVILLMSITFASAQQKFIDSIAWKELGKGLYYVEIDAPDKSILNDSKLTMLKVDHNSWQFNLLTASEYKRGELTAPEWATNFEMNVIVNAGMFTPAKMRPNKGYLKNFDHLNNATLHDSYNVMMAINPIVDNLPSFKIYDLTCFSWDSIKSNYNCFCQGMRMIDCNGVPLSWDKRPGQACSMVICATDVDGNIYFIFTRSPYTHKAIIGYLLSMPIDFRTTVYLEGGPEASLYISTPDTLIEKFGSYVSKTYQTDTNSHFWKLPNVIGIKKK